MVDAIAVYRTRSGVRRTSATDTLSVDVECYAPPAEGAIDRVEFSVVENGGAPTVLTVYAPTLRTPNYSAATSPLPGVSSGMAPLWCYGITLACSGSAVGDITVAYGTVQVTATVYTTAATASNPPDGPIILYNDADGGDRRPNPNTVYFHPTGNDSAAGTIGAPRRTIAGAVNRLIALGGSDLGGAKAIGLAGDHLWVGASMSNFYTSGHWPLTIEFEDGSTIARDTVTNQFFNGSGVGGSRCYVRFQGTGSANAARHIGLHLDVSNSTGRWIAWWDGMRSGSRFWSPGKLTIRYMEPAENAGTSFDKCGFQAIYRSYLSCCRTEGCSNGPSDRTDVHDCTIRDFVVLALGGGGYNGLTSASGMTYSAVNYLGWHGYVYHPEVLGWINVKPTAGQVVASFQPGGRMRLQATAQLYATRSGTTALDLPINIATNCAEIVGSTYWSIQIANWPGSNGKWQVVATGTDGGFPYIELLNSSFSAGPSPSGAHIYVEYASASGFDPHGGLDHWFGAGTHGSIHSNVVFYDIQNMQGPFWEADVGSTIDRCALVNYAVSSSYPTFDVRCPLGGTKTNCVLLNVSFNSGLDFHGSIASSLVADCVARSVGGEAPPANGVAGNVVTHNHTVSGSFGANSSTGAWFDLNPGASPWSWAPLGTWFNTASTTIARPTAYRWSGASGDSRGVWRNVGNRDWSVGSSGEVVTSGALPVGFALAAPPAIAEPEPIATATAPAGIGVGRSDTTLAQAGALVDGFTFAPDVAIAGPSGSATAHVGADATLGLDVALAAPSAAADVSASAAATLAIDIAAAAPSAGVTITDAGAAPFKLSISIAFSPPIASASTEQVVTAAGGLPSAFSIGAATGDAVAGALAEVTVSVDLTAGSLGDAVADVAALADPVLPVLALVGAPEAAASTDVAAAVNMTGIGLRFDAPSAALVTGGEPVVEAPAVAAAPDRPRRPWRAPPASKRPDRYWGRL